MKKLLSAILILSAAVISVGCSSNKASDNGLKIGDIAGKWSVTDIYNLYLTDSWDNIEEDLGDNYIYAVFNDNYTYSGKFNNDLFSGIFTIDGWSVVATAVKSNAADNGSGTSGTSDEVTITYAMSDFAKVNDVMTAEIDITFGGAEDGTMTVKVKKTE